MSQIHQFLFSNFDLLLALAFIWCISCFALFAWLRYRRGEWHPVIKQSHMRFSENYASGFSHKNIFTKFGGARNALSITVTNEAILTEPVAPFKWLMPFAFNDLEHYIPLKNIKKIEQVSRWGRNGVVLEFNVAPATTKRIELHLRYREQFLAAIS